MNANNPKTADKTGNQSTNNPGRTARFAMFAGLIAVILAGTWFVFTKPKASATPTPPPVVNVVTESVPIPREDTMVTETISDKPLKQAIKKSTVKAKTKESFNPARYLSTTVKTRKNVIGQAVIGGYITNISSSMVFKDIVLDVSYLSKTGAVITTQRFVVYEILKPGQKANFKFKTRQPAETKTYSTELVTAVEVK